MKELPVYISSFALSVVTGYNDSQALHIISHIAPGVQYTYLLHGHLIFHVHLETSLVFLFALIRIKCILIQGRYQKGEQIFYQLQKSFLSVNKHILQTSILCFI